MSREYLATLTRNETDKTRERVPIILRILVRQAMDSQEITYGKLGEELGLHHRALRHPLGCIRRILSEMSEQWQENIPWIQGLVVNKNTGLPGDNVNFLHHTDPREKEAIVETELGRVFRYPRWLDVLEALGLPPAAS